MLLHIELIERVCCRSVSVNRLTGQIPSYLGNITTLTALYDLTLFLSLITIFVLFDYRSIILMENLFRGIENNMFSGTVPPQLGNLVNMEILSVSLTFSVGKYFLI